MLHESASTPRYKSTGVSRMKKSAFASFAVLLFLPALAQADATCSSLTMTGHPAYMPIAWALDGKIVGAAPDLVRAIAGRLGVKTVTSKDYGSWKMAQAAAREGAADVIFGVYKNEERMKWLDYVEPAFMMDPVSVVVRTGEGFAYAKWDDLKGRRGVTNEGESFGDKFDRFMAASLTVARARGVDKAFEALLGRNADYLIVAHYPGLNIAKKSGVAAKVEFLPGEIDSFEMYVGFSRKSKCNAMKAAFARELRQEVAAGRVKQLLSAAQKRAER